MTINTISINNLTYQVIGWWKLAHSSEHALPSGELARIRRAHDPSQVILEGSVAKTLLFKKEESKDLSEQEVRVSALAIAALSHVRKDLPEESIGKTLAQNNYSSFRLRKLLLAQTEKDILTEWRRVIIQCGNNASVAQLAKIIVASLSFAAGIGSRQYLENELSKQRTKIITNYYQK